MNTYLSRIQELIKKIPVEVVDFSKAREMARIPTQASSNFITNKEQGDWAENLVFNTINEISLNYVAVKYGKSDDKVAGEEGFEQFFHEFQIELNTIGKRPDLLIFKKEDYISEYGKDISHINHELITDYVKKAIAGIEIRSSAFLIEQYDKTMKQRTEKYTKVALEIKDKILSEYSDLLNHPTRSNYIEILNMLREDNLNTIDFRTPNWNSNTRLIELKELFKSLRLAIKEVQKRDYLSITPKVEDIKVVYKWIETFEVPHFYFQVFFDKIYGISFEQILEIISDPNNEGCFFSIESDTKNQNKTTIKINSKSGNEIACKIDEPTHKSVRKEMGRGRLLFYVTFNGGKAYIDIEQLTKTLGIENGNF